MARDEYGNRYSSSDSERDDFDRRYWRRRGAGRGAYVYGRDMDDESTYSSPTSGWQNTGYGRGRGYNRGSYGASSYDTNRDWDSRRYDFDQDDDVIRDDYYRSGQRFEGYNRGPYGRERDFEGYNRGPYGRERDFEGYNRGQYGRERDFEGYNRGMSGRGRDFEGYNRDELARSDMSRSGYDRYSRQNRDYRSGGQSRYSQDYDYDYDTDWDADDEPTWTYVEYWWIVPGPYQGVGPQGYQRSDDRMCEEVCERMTQHGQVDPSEVEVSVENGEVTLSGTVSSRREKRMAEDIAESVLGISDVHNNLRVQQQGQTGWQGERSGAQSGRQGSLNRDQIREGMEVIGRSGERVGRVKEVRSSDFLVDRDTARDIYVPMSACHMSGGKVQLNIRADEVDSQNWRMPDIAGSEGDQARR